MAVHPTSVKLDTDTIQRLRKIADKHNLPMGWIINKAVERFLSEFEHDGPVILVQEIKRGGTKTK